MSTVGLPLAAVFDGLPALKFKNQMALHADFVEIFGSPKTHWRYALFCIVTILRLTGLVSRPEKIQTDRQDTMDDDGEYYDFPSVRDLLVNIFTTDEDQTLRSETSLGGQIFYAATFCVDSSKHAHMT